MFYLVIVLFILGYAAIALEKYLSVDKTAVVLTTGILIWICIAFGGDTFCFTLPAFQEYLQAHPDATAMEFIARHELIGHLGRISEVLFFLLGSMAIVKIIDSYGGFDILSRLIKTTSNVKLLWIFSFLTFFMSAVLDNLTATILMIALMWKFISVKNLRWIFTGMIVIASNAGGAWSPIGDITTVMLWTGGYINALNMIMQLFVPCLICMLVPLVALSLNIKGESAIPSRPDSVQSMIPTTNRQRRMIFLSGIGGLMLVPVFRSVTHLPPYMGVLLVLGVIWIMTEKMFCKEQNEFKMRLVLSGFLKKTDMSAFLFLLGALLAVAGLDSAGGLNMLGGFLDEKVHSIYAINFVIGTLSSVVDNVPLVAVSLGMYDVVTPDALAAISDPAKAVYMKHFVADGSFWELLSYCANTGGSILIIGSATGVAAMGLSKIDFVWYAKKISLLALAGYLTGFAAYYLIVG